MFGSDRLSERRIAKQAEINRRVWAATHDLEEPRSEREAPAWVDSAAELNRWLGRLPHGGQQPRGAVPGLTDASIAAMTEAVREAREFVNIEFYIMSRDDTTGELFAALEEAAARGRPRAPVVRSHRCPPGDRLPRVPPLAGDHPDRTGAVRCRCCRSAVSGAGSICATTARSWLWTGAWPSPDRRT